MAIACAWAETNVYQPSWGVPPRWLPAPSATAPTSPARWRRRPPDAYAMSFSFLSGRTFTDALAGLAFTSIRLTGPERIRHVLPGPLRGLLYDLDLHQAGYRASADGPFLDMALYDRFQRLEDIRDLPPRQLRLLRDIRKQLRFRHRLSEVLDSSCQHSLLEMSEPRLVLRPRMIPDQADPTPLGCDSGYAAKRARPASAGPAAPPLGSSSPSLAPRSLTEGARPRPRRTRSTVELQRRRRSAASTWSAWMANRRCPPRASCASTGHCPQPGKV